MEKLKKVIKLAWSGMSGSSMIGVAITLGMITMFNLHGAIVCMICIFLIVEGCERI